MAVVGDFGGDAHSEFVVDAFEPGESDDADAFEAAGTCARLPDAGAEDVDAELLQGSCGVHDLVLAFGGAGAGYDDGSFLTGYVVDDGE